MGSLIGMSSNTFFGKGLSRSDLFGLVYKKCLDDLIVDSVIPLFPFEGEKLSRKILKLTKKEQMQWFIEGWIRVGV